MTETSYLEALATKSKQELRKFFTVQGNRVFLTKYALHCGYIDIQRGLNGDIYKIEERSNAYRVICLDSQGLAIRWLDYYPRITIARSKINT